MSFHRIAFAVFVLVAGPVVLSGCGAARLDAQTATGERDELPGWVRVVVPSRDGRSYFVGGASFAASAEEGIEAATADASSQIEAEARRRFTTRLSLATSQSGVETTALERLDLRNRVAEAYADRMVTAAARDSVYHRLCGGAEGAEGGAGTGPVCQIFVLLSLPEEEWDAGFVQILLAEKRRRLEGGEKGIASLAEWLIRHVLEPRPEEGQERSR